METTRNKWNPFGGWSWDEADICIKFFPNGVHIKSLDPDINTEKVSIDSLVNFCTIVLSRELFRGKFNVFQEAFSNDLKEAVGEVLKIYKMRTSPKNHRNFSQFMEIKYGKVP